MLKLSVNKTDILNPLSKVQTIVDKKNIISIINNVFIYTDENYLFIEATDLEISYKNKISCTIIQHGGITINARKLYEIIREFPCEKIELEEKKNSWLQIKGGEKAEYKIGGLPPDDFPKFTEINSENFLELKASIINELIEKTIFSALLDDRKSAFGGKSSLGGIYLEVDKHEEGQTLLRMVTSDGHRLSLIDKYVQDTNFHLDSPVIIPRKGAQEIRKIIEDHDIVKFGIDDKFCFVTCGHNKLIIRLIDGKFPDYNAIIPKSRDRYFTFNKLQVFNALKRISILSSDTTFRGVKISLTSNAMEIESMYREIGEAREIIDVEYNGEPFEIAINAKYIMDILLVMESDMVELISNDSESPCLLKGNDDKGFLGLIMPMNIVEEAD